MWMNKDWHLLCCQVAVLCWVSRQRVWVSWMASTRSHLTGALLPIKSKLLNTSFYFFFKSFVIDAFLELNPRIYLHNFVLPLQIYCWSKLIKHLFSHFNDIMVKIAISLTWVELKGAKYQRPSGWLILALFTNNLPSLNWDHQYCETVFLAV